MIKKELFLKREIISGARKSDRLLVFGPSGLSSSLSSHRHAATFFFDMPPPSSSTCHYPCRLDLRPSRQLPRRPSITRSVAHPTFPNLLALLVPYDRPLPTGCPTLPGQWRSCATSPSAASQPATIVGPHAAPQPSYSMVARHWNLQQPPPPPPSMATLPPTAPSTSHPSLALTGTHERVRRQATVTRGPTHEGQCGGGERDHEFLVGSMNLRHGNFFSYFLSIFKNICLASNFANLCDNCRMI
jgi:hypothetical protein